MATLSREISRQEKVCVTVSVGLEGLASRTRPNDRRDSGEECKFVTEVMQSVMNGESSMEFFL